MTEIKEAKKPETAVAKKESTTAVKTAPRTMKDYVAIMEPEIKKALPSMIKPERFTRMIYSTLSNNPELQKCTTQSFLGAMMSAAQAGVEPNTVTGEAWILPYKDHGTLKAQFQIGARGMARLAQRDGTVVLPPQTVYENDEFHYQLGSEPKLEHIPAMKDRGKPIGYYAVWKNAKYESEGFYFMSREDVEKHAKKYSKSYNSSFSPWTTSFDSMAEKTVVKRALKYAPISVETAAVMASDETIKSDISADMSLIQDETDYMDAEVTEVVDNETGEVKDGE